DTRTCWSSTYNLLKNLLLLRNAIIQLADDLRQSVNQQERQDSLKILEALLSTEEWNSLDELAKLLYPFAQATGYIGGNQYPTLGMMIPTLIKLSRHLRDFYSTITSITVKACCHKINESMLSRWFELSLNSLIASFLDLRFKKMKTEPSSTNSSFFASFYDDNNDILIANKNSSSVEEE
ncbi:12877_t:CDS:2, partial [Dentiscutata heterogama]